MADEKQPWFMARVGNGDFCFQADIQFTESGDLPDVFPVRYLTQVIAGTQGVSFGLYPPEKLGMTTGKIVMRRDSISMIAAASPEMIDDMEKAWDLKKITVPRMRFDLKNGK
jgi:hypothetical protein